MYFHLTRMTFCIALWCCGALASSSLCVAVVRAQSVQAEAGSSSIAGRVTSDDKGMAGIAVLAMAQDFNPRGKPAARAKTDSEGRYMMTGVPAGRYTIMPLAPAFVIADLLATWPPGKAVSVVAGETIEGVDFQLTRGGVITGRITDADGKPVVSQMVRVAPADEQTTRRPRFMAQPGVDRTDDRGIYRIYGLPAGRYRVSAGEDAESGMMSSGPGRSFYRHTFYPGVTEESKAEIVEVKAGSEAAGIDIELGAISKTYKVTGRILDAENGQALAGVSVIFGPLSKDSRELRGALSGGSVPSNARGEFQLSNVLSGRYALFATSEGEGEWYSEPLYFEVAEADVGGLELKVRRGASISGVVEIEGTPDRAALERLLRAHIGAHYLTRNETTPPIYTGSRINADRSFRIEGFRPGRVNLSLDGREGRGLTLLRIERGGVEIRDGIEVAAKEHLTGVRVVVGYGNGVIRGQVKIENGTLPAGTRMAVSARPLIDDAKTQRSREAHQVVDERGRFTLEGLMAGDYELVLRAFSVQGGGGQPPPETRQRVTVSGTGETTVTLNMDLSAGGNANKP